jgi:hypothetical protein
MSIEDMEARRIRGLDDWELNPPVPPDVTSGGNRKWIWKIKRELEYVEVLEGIDDMEGIGKIDEIDEEESG